MAIDTPATIAIIGAGSVGIEAALYARFLGYDVQVFERGSVGAHLLNDDNENHRRAVGRCCSPLGLRALTAQDSTWSLPDLESLWTPREFVESYLEPLSRTDLLDGLIFEQTVVTDVRRTELAAEDAPRDEESPQQEEESEGDDEYEEVAPRLPPLRVTWQRMGDADSSPAHFDADIVIDASGISAAGPDDQFVAALRFERCPKSGRPLPAAIDATAGAAAELILAEPNFYILGSKSRGQRDDFESRDSERSGFEIVDGLRQIRDLFGLIGGRATLDLYQDLGQFR